EVAAWAQPGGDALEQRALLGARDVADRVERGDPVEAGWWQFDRGHLGLDEAGAWYVLAGKFELAARQVNADHVAMLGQQGGAGNPGSAAEIEHRGALGQAGKQVAQERQAGIAPGLVDPGQVTRGDAVVSGRYDVRRVGGHQLASYF